MIQRRSLLPPLEIDLGKALAESPMDYVNEPKEPWPTFLIGLPIGIASFLAYWPIYHLVAPYIPLPSWIAGVFVFLLTFAIAGLHADSRVKNSKALDAVETLTWANDSVIVLINTVKDPKLWEKCHRLYTYLLRSIYCLAVGREFEVILREQKCISIYYDVILAKLTTALAEAELLPQLLVGNGRLTVVLAARSAINNLVSIPIPRSIYIANIIFSVLSFLTVAILLARESTLHQLWGATIMAFFAYGVSLLIIIARSRSLPYGGGRHEIEMNWRFKRYEEKNLEAAEAARDLCTWNGG